MLVNKLLAAMDNGETVDVFTIIDSTVQNDTNIGEMANLYMDGSIEGGLDEYIIQQIQDIVRQTNWSKPVSIRVANQAGDQYRIFWDRITNKLRAIVLGGGHVSQALVQVLSLLEFEITVIDDRPEFANRARFPGASQVICESFQLALKDLTISRDTAVIIVTRGHRYDMDCLRSTMGSHARYLGMIGSKRRVKEVVALLQEEGAPEDLAKRLRAPIGLDIKAETPAEIAVSIAAEVVSVFRGGSGVPLSMRKEAF